MSISESLPVLTSAMEDYLEAIYHLEQERRIARVRDIANRLNVKMSSVSSALKTLDARGLIRYDPHQYITLTDSGIEKAKQIVRKHEILKRFLTRVLKIDEAAAEDNACRIEHHLDPEVIEKLIRFVEFMEMCPIDQTRWLEAMTDSCDKCLPCLDAAKDKVLSRAVAQRVALEEGLTLAETHPGSQIIIESVKGPSKIRKILSDQGLECGVILEVEQKGCTDGQVMVNMKGYHISLTEEQAAKIFVKPI
jgi:DtxR family transcriptional regulator, Mn-dependent transcriptional regulator